MFKGSIVAIVTPFKNGKIDETSLRNLVNWHIDEGTHGIVPVGFKLFKLVLKCFIGNCYFSWKVKKVHTYWIPVFLSKGKGPKAWKGWTPFGHGLNLVGFFK